MKLGLPDSRHFLAVGSANVPLLALAVFAMLLDALLTVMRPWPLKVVIDRVIPPSPRTIHVPFIGEWLSDPAIERLPILYGACATTILIAIGTGLLTYWYTRTMGEISQRYVFSLRQILFAHMQRLSLLFHDRQRTGDLTARLTSDVQSIQDVVANNSVILLGNMFLLLGMIVMMLWLNWKFALIALSVAPILFLSIYNNTRHIKNASRQARSSAGHLASLAQETLSSIRIVQGLAQEDQLDRRFAAQSTKSLQAYLYGVKYQAAVAPIVDILAAIGLCLVMWFGATWVMAGELTTGDVVIFFAYVTNLYSPMRALSKSSNSTARALVGIERIAEVLKTRSDVADLPGAKPLRVGAGEIEFRDVSFAYPGRPRTLESINLVINPGETVAIVGATGTGKSTLVSLVPRLYDPVQGAVLIDGQDVRTHSVKSVRSQISMVLQDSLLFSGTIRENIAFGRPESTDEEIIAAARVAKAHDFIHTLPDGYDTEISEGGTTLSGGQRQRISIARACLRNSPILVLDEPTSGLDVVSERAVIQALGAAAKARTTLIIAHRLATVRFADRIIVLDRGRIVEMGTHQQLLANLGGYARLYDLQSLQCKT
ncbi:ATP-binding cassette domain-containing protein [Bradyrhizobium pachyrhizi]|uniref:ATP-binding cassette domain-containing protein n=1 Tax=Bradyrhizobium pachyrhizi TaxID=280333 RepID=A0A844T8I3_9BRAD|nr:ATP-binding cassette domain-containing protein [Bradyrhizobium pachyrhizi]